MASTGPSLYSQAGQSTDLTRSTEEDSLVDGPLISADVLQSAIRREFQSVPTTCSSGVLSLMHVLYVVLSLCVGIMCVLKFGKEEVCLHILGSVKGDCAIVFGKVFLWALTLLHSLWMQHHHSRARSRGYLRFYRQTRRLQQLPLITHSTGNVFLLLLLALKLPLIIHTSLLLSILGVEVLVAVPCLLYYTVKVMQFNRERAAPDVSQEEHSHTYTVTSLATETGFRGSNSLEEVVEKQADLIEYLKQHNALLSKRLLNLTAQH
ncbi:PREDICTED: transmembrane protein 192 isoform X1 [Cyprinodon variegatus]|uniref:Transmembrane protein 192 n=1 Tax=Cyprinodon variegatus TaxID=28743 RepID=A0A3Q2DYI4_CYPVA|nr:PREDICTED: transmembrane protein 192 isoform X1 [Cyprinodon variegatus]